MRAKEVGSVVDKAAIRQNTYTNFFWTSILRLKDVSIVCLHNLGFVLIRTLCKVCWGILSNCMRHARLIDTLGIYGLYIGG